VLDICRAAKTYGTPQYEEMRAKCIGQELSWEVPAGKWESVLRDVQAGRKPQVDPPFYHFPKELNHLPSPTQSDLVQAGRKPQVPAGTPVAPQTKLVQAGHRPQARAPLRSSRAECCLRVFGGIVWGVVQADRLALCA